MAIHTLIADSNPISRKTLCALLAVDPEIEVTAECHSVERVRVEVNENAPSLMLLDTQLPGLNCLDLVTALGKKPLLATIFIVPAGYETEARGASSFDYLTRPISPKGLLTVLERAKSYINCQGHAFVDRGNSGRFRGSKCMPGNRNRIVIKAKGRLIFVRTEEIDWIQGNRNYVRVHVGTVSYLHRQTMREMANRLDTAQFLRIHRSAIVNLEKIRELRTWPTGEYVVLMRNGKELTLSRGYRTRLPLIVGGQIQDDDPIGMPVPRTVREETRVAPFGEVDSVLDQHRDMGAPGKRTSIGTRL